MRWFRVVFLAVLCLFTCANDVSFSDIDSSGEEDDDPFLSVEKDAPLLNEALDNDALLDRILSRVVHFRPDRFNSTLQLELVRAEEELYRGRIGLTLWLHQSWTDPSYAFSPKTTIKRLKLPLDVLLPKVPTPQTVVKNALYFKEHSTPMLNGFATLDADGTFTSHQKVTIDLPCVKHVGYDHEYSSDDSFPVCSRSSAQSKNRPSVEIICELRFGSYIRDETLLNLQWNFNAIVTQTVPCTSTSGKGGISACNVRETQTLRRQTVCHCIRCLCSFDHLSGICR